MTFQRPLFGFLGRMGLTEAVAAETAQETFIRAWRNLAQYDPERAEFSTWLFSIARNIALNELTRAASRYEVRTGSATVNVVFEGLPPLDQTEQEQSGGQLRRLLARLPLADRTALALTYVKELKIADVAALEGTTVGAIKTRLHRAKLQLREWLEVDNE